MGKDPATGESYWGKIIFSVLSVDPGNFCFYLLLFSSFYILFNDSGVDKIFM